jgi:hypothetical protein
VIWVKLDLELESGRKLTVSLQPGEDLVRVRISGPSEEGQVVLGLGDIETLSLVLFQMRAYAQRGAFLGRRARIARALGGGGSHAES